ncbi:MAG: UDP-N-acetylglucosamine 2-epimerase (non-hydrolyzing) [Deltaproteobacteria bacterium]|nr:UDP-N-acetylglucosamine 2-epimerase (non-hydrolyzing) [Deltaproteobacteria bacterium]
MRRPAHVRRVVNIVGTRPNLVKMAAVLAAQRARPDAFAPLLVHTGQHRDAAMSAQLLAELELPPPDVMLGCDGVGQADQVGGMLQALSPVLAQLRPDLVVVVGDVNSTAAGALAAAMHGVPVAHVEAGLRSFDRAMPEELNRIVVDAVSDLLFASEASAVENLAREGRPATAVHHVGNVMIDTLVRFRARAAARDPRGALGLDGGYGVLTLHRPSNVDDAAGLAALLAAVGAAARRLPIVFPVHPRTRRQLGTAALRAVLAACPGLRPVEPLGYLDMLALMERAELVLTDSGGIQEETTYLGVPCLTLRANTERPATVSHGSNRVVGTAPARVTAEIHRVLDGDRPAAGCPPLWDGSAAQRVAEVLASATRC